MGDNSCPTAADVLGHAPTRAGNLIGAGLAAQLLGSFNDLVEAGCPYRMAARF
jgi:hypothetical protein